MFTQRKQRNFHEIKAFLFYYLPFLPSSLPPVFRNSVPCSLTGQVVHMSKPCGKHFTHFISLTPHHPVEIGTVHILTLLLRPLRQRKVKGLFQMEELVSMPPPPRPPWHSWRCLDEEKFRHKRFHVTELGKDTELYQASHRVHPLAAACLVSSRILQTGPRPSTHESGQHSSLLHPQLGSNRTWYRAPLGVYNSSTSLCPECPLLSSPLPLPKPR